MICREKRQTERQELVRKVPSLKGSCNAVPASIRIEVFEWKLPHAVIHPLMVTVGRWFCLSKDTDNCVILYP